MEPDSKKPIRVLQVNSGSEYYGGVSSFLYNMYKYIDKQQIQFDFLSPNRTTYEIHRAEIEHMGGRLYELGIQGNVLTRKIKLYKKIRKFLVKNKYKIVHINSGNFFFNFVAVSAAKKAGAAIRIVHSHNAGDTIKSRLKDSLIKCAKPFMEHKATHLYACSKIAADYMFTQKRVREGKVSIIPNGIETRRFAYDEGIRREVRRELGIETKLVIGNVARFTAQKNHLFIIDILEAIIKKQENVMMLLVGQGSLEKMIHEEVERKGLGKQTMFLGQRTDVDRLYQAMDVFLLPSIHEGFGIVNIEAQASGLVCVASDGIPEEADVTHTMVRMSLDRPAAEWADVLIEAAKQERKPMDDIVLKAGYEVNSIARMLQTEYFEALLKCGQGGK